MKNWGKFISMFLGIMIFSQMAVIPAAADADQLPSISPVSVIAAPASAAQPATKTVSVTDSASYSASDSDSKITLEQAIRIVKENFDVPSDYSNFTSGFNTYNNRQAWSLNWSAPEGKGGNFNAQVDGNSGDIININCWNGSSNSGMHLPAISYEEAIQAAQELLKRIVPGKMDQIKLIADDSQIVPLNYYGPFNYTVQWQRVINGIPFQGDGITISVNGDNKQISSYSINWSDVKFPNADGVISAEKAKEIFISTPMLEAKYSSSLIYRPIPMITGDNQKALLVYTLTNKYQNGAIDALSGKPLILEDGQWLANNGGPVPLADESKALNTGSSSPTPLTPEEQKEIEKTSKLITKDQAVSYVKKIVGIPEDFILRDVNLGTDSYLSGNRIWSLSWDTEPQKDKQAQYMYARINAETGELLGYSISVPSPSDNNKDVLDRQAAEKLAEDFIQKVQPDRFKQTKLSEEENLQSDKNQPQYFVYQRFVNGLPFTSNSISVTVDPVTKKICNFNLNWSDIEFPSLDGMLNNLEAGNAFLKNRPMTLSYVQVYDNGRPADVRLVYLPQASEGNVVSNIMDAKTGEFLTMDGKPVSQSPKAYKFSDIAGNFAEKEIGLLGQAGIFGEYGDTFKPDENVTLISLLRGILAAQNGIWYTQNMTDKELIKAAQDQNLLKEDLDINSEINRIEFSKLLIRFLGLEYVAKLQLGYRSPYLDTNYVPSNEIGYLALTKGFDLIKTDGKLFKPDLKVTRAEAAYAIVKALSIDKQ